MNILFRIILLLLITGSACDRADISSCQKEDHQLYQGSSFPVGVAVNVDLLDSHVEYQEIVRTQFNSITPENIFKPAFLHPDQDQFSWKRADELVQYCQEQGKRLHGHTLIWHTQLPLWMEQFNGTSAEWEEMMKIHIQTILTHFKGSISSWDVVNEAFEDDGSLRQTIWLEHIGESYIEKAFQYAHEADSSVLLFYNDYNLTAKDKKREAAIQLFNSLRSKGIRIDGIGMQMHISHNHPESSAITEAMTEVWRNDYLLHISELDVSVNPLGRNMDNPSTSRLNRQAETYVFVFAIYQTVPPEFQHGISIWGVSDADSWIPSFFGRDDYPLLFDEDYQPKAAYCVLVGD